jgi:heat-inducible transcriptional repressor
MVEISERQQAILKTVVEDFVITANPVPSDRVTKRSGLKVSSATVRNEMMELEERGLLTHPHTSSGRVPTDLGYRYYLEHLMTEVGLTPVEQQMIIHQFHQVETEVDEWGPLAAAVTAQMSRSAALVTKLQSREGRLKRIELVSVQDDLVLVVIILHSGALRQRLLRMDLPIEREELIKLSNRLSDLLKGKDGYQIAQVVPNLVGAEREIVQVVARTMEQDRWNWADAIHFEGISFISEQPEFGRTQQFIDLMEVLQRGGSLMPLLAEVLETGGMRVVIGKENLAEQMQGCSVILKRYGPSGEAAGIVGVVGPTRMRYWRAVSLVRFMAGLLDRLVEQPY